MRKPGRGIRSCVSAGGGGGGGEGAGEKVERGRYCKELLTPSRSKIMTSFSRPVFKFQKNEKQRIAPNVG